ncbi:MAG: hypothetical protein A2X84_09780 [Desulfuromonadaceae bacterium GWC2_58_13]|nr:MAG: hypothetical protein A2X84_09780 [Desulfuromonadaceae bacterium GWC2_58_13]
MTGTLRLTIMLPTLLLVLLAGCVRGPFVKSAPPRETTAAPAWDEHRRVQQTLDEMIAAYQDKDAIRFSGYLSENYTGDDRVFDTQIRRGLKSSHDIGIRYTIDNITSDGRGKVFVAVTYTREHTDIATTQRVVDTGRAALIFVREGPEYRLLSQPKPLF